MRPRAAIALAAICVSLVGCNSSTPSPTISELPRAPDALPEVDAGTFSSLLAAERGTPVVVNFWAAWCDPCEAEAPLLTAAAERAGHRVRFIGVDTLDDRTDAEGFIKRFGLPYPSVFDPTNSIGLSYDLFAPPATLFFDRDGDLVRTIPGEISEQDLRDGIRLITGPAE
jgi:thiol-disulfide isomerase/thioredoxin